MYAWEKSQPLVKQERSKHPAINGEGIDWHDALAYGGQGENNTLCHRLHYSFLHLSDRAPTRSKVNDTTISINYWQRGSNYVLLTLSILASPTSQRHRAS